MAARTNAFKLSDSALSLTMNTSYTQLYKSVYEPDVWLKAAEGKSSGPPVPALTSMLQALGSQKLTVLIAPRRRRAAPRRGAAAAQEAEASHHRRSRRRVVAAAGAAVARDAGDEEATDARWVDAVERRLVSAAAEWTFT